MCELSSEGKVRCGGANVFGEVGDGTVEVRTTWSTVPGIEDAVDLTAGYNHFCVRLADSTVRCWGDNRSVQIGDGTVEPRWTPTSPTKVHDVAQVSAGMAHTCVRMKSGDVDCWGGNLDGVAPNFDLDRPSRFGHHRVLRGNVNATQLVTGNDRSYARTKTGWVKWHQRRGTPMPQAMPELDDAIEIVSGANAECALNAKGQARCWLLSHDPRLAAPSLAPTPLAIPNVSKIALGREHGCALSGGTVYCWGANESGQLGEREVREVRELYDPAPVPGITDAIDITCGFTFSCARLSNDRIRCWGDTTRLPNSD